MTRRSYLLTLTLCLSMLVVGPTAVAHERVYKEQAGCTPTWQKAWLVSWNTHFGTGTYQTLQKSTLNVGPCYFVHNSSRLDGCYGPVSNYLWYRVRTCTNGYLQGTCSTVGKVFATIEQCDDQN